MALKQYYQLVVACPSLKKKDSALLDTLKHTSKLPSSIRTGPSEPQLSTYFLLTALKFNLKIQLSKSKQTNPSLSVSSYCTKYQAFLTPGSPIPDLETILLDLTRSFQYITDPPPPQPLLAAAASLTSPIFTPFFFPTGGCHFCDKQL